MFPYEPDQNPAARAERMLACQEVWREEAILAALDPDRLCEDELPDDVSPAQAAEWREFVALCERTEAGAAAELEPSEEMETHRALLGRNVRRHQPKDQSDESSHS